MDKIFNDYISIGDYKIGKLCYQSYPCQHMIKNSNSNECQFLTAIEIYKILENEGLSHPHFNYCKSLIQKSKL